MKNTIKNRKNFDFEGAATIVMPAFVVKYRPKISALSEYGIVAAKRTFSTAVQRNRAKRLIRAWMDKCERPKKFDVLFIARKDILETGLTRGVGQMAKTMSIVKKAGRRKKPRPDAPKL